MELLSYLINDWQALLKIILSDVILSVDNALVIAMVCAGLKPEHQGTAMKWGMSVAVLARILFLLIAFILVQIPFLKILAGLWLVKLGYEMMNNHGGDESLEQKSDLKSAIIAIVLADVAMSLDNVLAVVGASGEGQHVLYNFELFGKVFEISDSYPLAIVGVLISIPILLFASKALMKLVEKYPVLNVIGALGITFIGVEMAIKDNAFKGFIENLATQISLTSNTFVTFAGLAITGLLYLLFKLIGKKLN